MNNNVDIEKLKSDVLNVFYNGYSCSESMIYSLNKHFDFKLSDDAIEWHPLFHQAWVDKNVFAELSQVVNVLRICFWKKSTK